jgi:hypothetical protein
METHIENEEIISEEFRDKLLSFKEEKDLTKYLQKSKENLIIVIKELIKYFKEKISEYEKQITKLNDDKDELQTKINEMIFQYLRAKEKYANNNNNIENADKTEKCVDLKNFFDIIKNNEKEEDKIIESSLIYVNRKLIEQNKELKEQLEIFKNILDIDNKNKNSFEINKFENNINTVSYEENKEEFSKIEKEKISPTILSLLKQLAEYKKSEKIKKDRKKKKNEKLDKTSNLPNIEQYFIFNNKFQLVDSEKNLYHMRKCYKFQEFKKNYKAANNSSEKDENILIEFVDLYLKDDEEKDEENIDNLEDKKTSSTKPNIENNTNKEQGNNEDNNGNAKKENNNKNL